MADPSDLTLDDLGRLRAQGRILFIRHDLAQTPDIFGRNLLLRGLTILSAMFTPESRRLAAQRFRARLYDQRIPDTVTPPEGMVVFPLEDLSEQRYVIAIAPAEEQE